MADQTLQTLYVPVDCAGPVGAFPDEGSARAALDPYLAAHWSGALFVWELNEPIAPDADVCFLMPEAESAIPVAVGGVHEIAEIQKALDPTGLVAPAEDLEWKVSGLGLLVPAKKRLEAILHPEDHTDNEAVKTFLELVDRQTSVTIPDADPETRARRFPIAPFIQHNPEPLCPHPDANSDGDPVADLDANSDGDPVADLDANSDGDPVADLDTNSDRSLNSDSCDELEAHAETGETRPAGESCDGSEDSSGGAIAEDSGSCADTEGDTQKDVESLGDSLVFVTHESLEEPPVPEPVTDG